ncbi:MAG: hypothetical protein EBT78_15090 [Betaproteobacteria bacterium]|nr:hypothetical protein [Betaproteobacteria bacterium]
MAAKNISPDTITKNTMSKKAAVEDCLICCEPFNKSCHLPVECEQVGCKYKACLECVRAYLLTSVNEPHCMECKVNWSAKFMLVLKKGWLSDTYRPHREKFLCDIELAKLAETMPAAENYKAWKNQEAVVEALRQKYLAVKRELEVISDELTKAARLSSQLKHGKETKEEKKEFFMPCPAVNCNGLLSTQYKCGICDMFTCADCHEVIGTSKMEAHTCDPNNVASALAIKKETKQCPGCHNRIYRIEGCSQMWCTGCHTAFDWNTGRKVETGQLHNPHWLEYQRGLGTVPRAPGDVPCGGLCSYSELNRNILVKIRAARKPNDGLEEIHQANERICNTLRYIHRLVENITNNDVRETRERNQSLSNFKDQRVKYIVGEMTKQQFSAYIFRSDKTRQKNTEMLNVYELLSAVGIDFFNKLTANPHDGDLFVADVNEQIANYDKLRSYCNGLFAVIGNTYGMTVPQFAQNWSRHSGKFNSKTLKMMAEDEVSC